MLKIKDLNVEINAKKILENFNMDINEGEIHAVMGPNGVGKSTLSKVLMGDKNYEVLSGSITFNDKNLLSLETDERSKAGIFLSMQNPLEIEGVSNQDFLRTAMTAHQNKNIGLYEFITNCENSMNDLNMDSSLIHRSLNVGFSGGERKKNEVLQIKLLKPKFIILDELDSGLDVDSLKTVAMNIRNYLDEFKNVSVLIITHYPRILEYLKPDFVHVLMDGRIIKTSDYNLALEIEKKGYKNIINKTNIVTEDNINE